MNFAASFLSCSSTYALIGRSGRKEVCLDLGSRKLCRDLESLTYFLSSLIRDKLCLSFAFYAASSFALSSALRIRIRWKLLSERIRSWSVSPFLWCIIVRVESWPKVSRKKTELVLRGLTTSLASCFFGESSTCLMVVACCVDWTSSRSALRLLMIRVSLKLMKAYHFLMSSFSSWPFVYSSSISFLAASTL